MGCVVVSCVCKLDIWTCVMTKLLVDNTHTMDGCRGCGRLYYCCCAQYWPVVRLWTHSLWKHFELLSSAVSRRGGDVTTSSFTVYTLTRNILERWAPFLWALSGLLASMSLHLVSVAVPEVLRLGSWQVSIFIQHRGQYSVMNKRQRTD